MATELKPCPFCGGEARIEHDHSGHGWSFIRCESCGVASVKFPKLYDRASDDDAVRYWNRRAIDEV